MMASPKQLWPSLEILPALCLMLGSFSLKSHTPFSLYKKLPRQAFHP